jgi:hypothetical protein
MVFYWEKVSCVKRQLQSRDRATLPSLHLHTPAEVTIKKFPPDLSIDVWWSSERHRQVGSKSYLLCHRRAQYSSGTADPIGRVKIPS